MGERRKRALGVEFDRNLKLEFHGANVTSDAGLLAHRELDEALRLTWMGAVYLVDPRRGKNIQHTLHALLSQAVFSRVAGYEDTNDAERLRVDPAMRAVVSERAKERGAASKSEVGRFETEILTRRYNRKMLRQLCGQWVDRAHACAPPTKAVLDMDSSESPTHGEQEGSEYNGYFDCTCYHPLFCFNQFGDVEGALLRPGSVHSAEDWRKLLEPILARYLNRKIPIFFRGDAGFAAPEIYECLEANGALYAIRLKTNDVLMKAVAPLLTRPVGRPSRKPRVFLHSFEYQAESWSKPRRVVAKIEWHEGELFPRVRFIVTNLTWRNKSVVRFYNKRGTAEQWIKEGKGAIRWTRLSCHDFKDNDVRLQLFVLAYNLANFLRRLALPRPVKHWSLTTLREKLVKIGAKVVRHSRYMLFQMAAVAVPKELFAAILEKISRLRPAPG